MGDGTRTKKGGSRTSYQGVYRVDSTTYRVRGEWTCSKTGRRRELDRIVTAASAEEAAVLRASLKAEMRAAILPATRPRLGEFARSWLAEREGRIKESTREHYTRTYLGYIEGDFADFYLDAITKSDVSAWFARQTGTAQTRNGRLRVFRILLGAAEADEFIRSNVATRVEPVKVVREEDDHKVLSVEDLARLLAWLREKTNYGDIAMTLAFTGMRYGEAASLKFSDLDFERGTIRIARGYYRGDVGTPKTGKARTVGMPPQLAEALASRRARQLPGSDPGEGGWVFGSNSRNRPASLPGRGQPVRQVGLASALKRAAVALGLPAGLSPHWFRHSWNDLLRRTASGEVQRALVGHSSSKMSEHYSHVGIEERKSAVIAAAALIGLAPVGPSGDESGDIPSTGRDGAPLH